MAGELVPLVMVPRYSCYSGATTFTSIPIDCTRYSIVALNVWRAPLVGSSPTFGITLQESTDQESWTTVDGTTANSDPGADTQALYEGNLKRRWFRVRIILGGTDPVATCWAVGTLEMRET